MKSSPLLQIAGSALAGAAGFAAGFYAGFFLILSIWGLEFHSLAFPLITGVFGGLFAGVAIALTVSEGRRAAAVVTASMLGLVLALLIILVDGDAGAMLVGGVVVVVTAASIVRTGMADRLSGT